VVGVGFLVLGAVLAGGQPPGSSPVEPTRAGAFKLPDGTVIFFSKTPDEANPPIDGVLLTPQEYKTLVEQSEQLKKLKAGPRPQSPSVCQIRGRVEARGERSVAALTLTYSFRTTLPRTLVVLGCQQAFPLAARLGTEKLPPVLTTGEDGLTVLVERPGDHTLTLEIEVPVTMRGMGRELGYELSLPRAAITTLAVDPPASVKRVTVGVRTAADRPGELTQTTGEPAVVAGRTEKPVPLGPVETLLVSWETPATQSAGPDATTAAEHEIVVRVDETQIETTSKIRLRGPVREWVLALPAGADVAAARVSPTVPREPPTLVEPAFGPGSSSPTLVRPTDPSRSIWHFRPPDGPGPDWELTVTTRQARTKPGETSHQGPYHVGPFAVQNAARQTGTIRVYATPTVKLRDFRTGPEVRRPDVPPVEESLVALFRFSTTADRASKPATTPLLSFEARQVPGFVRVQPNYEVLRTEGGCRLQLTARVTPIRTELEQVVIEIPPGWEGVEAGPAELVDEVQVLKQSGSSRRLAIGLLTPQKTPFDLTLTAAYVLPAGAREASLALPRFPGATESGSRVVATAPEPFEVRGTLIADGPAGGAFELVPTTTSPQGVKSLARSARPLERGVSRVDLTWQQYRPELVADVRAEVGLQERQAVVSQTLRFRSVEPDIRPVRLKGPAAIGGLRASPPLEPIGPGEWQVHPPADAREYTLTLSYALPLPPRRTDQTGPTRFVVGLLWPDAATRVESAVRVWGSGTTRRVLRFEGPWQELPPEPAPDRDTLPWLTLAGTGAAVPLTLDLTEPAEGTTSSVVVERSLLQAWVSEDGAAAVRGRFVVSHWPATGLDLELPVGTTPTILIDDRKVDVSPIASRDGTLRVRLTAPVATTSRPPLRLDVRYQTQSARSLRGDIWQLVFPSPRLGGAIDRTSPRWQVVHPARTVPILMGRELMPESRWAWRTTTFGPVPVASTDELEQWIRNGNESGLAGEESMAFAWPGGGALTARQPSPGPVRLILIPRIWLMTGISLVVFALGFGVSRLRPAFIGPALAGLGVAVAVLVIGWPQPAAELAAAGQPGVVLLAFILATAAAVRWYYRKRIVHLPGFTRGPAEPVTESATGPAPSGPRSSQNGPIAIREESGSSPPLASTGS
jgi:hypothetical protein